MRNVLTILRRELAVYLRSPAGYVILALALAVDGLFFNTSLSGQQRSAQVLESFFLYASGVAITASVFIAMRLLAAERESGTWVLLATSPVRDWQVVLGKFLGGVTLLLLLNLLSVYMPALLLLHGKISVGHLFAGYLGILLISSASLALGLFCSAIAPSQLLAVILGGALVVVFILLWLLSRVASAPVEDVLAYLSLHDKHFRPFMRGLISLQDVLFYLSLIYVALTAATRVLESRRWR